MFPSVLLRWQLQKNKNIMKIFHLKSRYVDSSQKDNNLLHS